MTDIVERLRAGEPCQPHGDLCRMMEARSGCTCAEAADEIERLRELFRKDGEDHAAHVKGLVEQHETRMTRYAEEIERLRKLPDILAAEIERLRGIPDWKIGEGKPRDIRSDALEEAAKVAWEHDDDVGAVIADAICALKEKV